ncbi:MAG TPA: hypothetical protein VMW54_05390 [Terriglobia bacterium]|nr:hypothetical protein [Terriglobia bacterium]
MKRVFCLAAMLAGVALAFGGGNSRNGLVDGFPVKAGHPVFPIGFYEMPKTNAELQTMAKAGVNLVQCGNAEDLKRARAAGMMGWVALPLASADPAKIRATVEALKDNPALVAWEGPDEFVSDFRPMEEWGHYTPAIIARSEAKARILMPRLLKNIRLVRSLDARHPIWINEAIDSDMKLVREYMDHIDITGCDIYPIHGYGRHPSVVGDATDRFLSLGENRPVWMVLQGFGWHDLHDPHFQESLAYPSFPETRLMAYSAISHGASAVLYWGTHYLPSSATGRALRNSIYALTSELAKLQPFLTAPEDASVRVKLTESTGRSVPGERGVRWLARRVGSDWVIVLVNEDNHPHLGVEVEGLDALNGRKLVQLYGPETDAVSHGEFVARLMPREVKVFSTSRKWASSWTAGRDFPGQ